MKKYIKSKLKYSKCIKAKILTVYWLITGLREGNIDRVKKMKSKHSHTLRLTQSVEVLSSVKEKHITGLITLVLTMLIQCYDTLFMKCFFFLIHSHKH